MFAKIRNFMLYAGLDPDQFHKVCSLVASENVSALIPAAIVQALYFGVSLISSLGIVEMADKRLVYSIGTIIPIIALILYFLFRQYASSFAPWLVRLYCIGIFITGLLCTLICTPDEMTILLLIFFFCIPMLFVVCPLEQLILVLFTDIIYYTAAPFLKTPDVLTIDMIDIGIFSTVSVILGIGHMSGRYRRYWLETNAVDLAEVRYQAAFIDQLTEVFNRNAYNKASEEIAKSPLSPDFMYIALDLNGLKAANDTFGHIAGDELLIGAAECMKKTFDNFGQIYRVGGDEFIIMLNMNGRPTADILSAFNEAVESWHGSLIQNLSVSYGVVMGNETADKSFHEVELLADKRMYQSKSDYYKNAGIDRRRK